MRVLDKGGAILAIAFGAILFFFGGPEYLILMLIFFFLAIVVTKYEYEIKRDGGLYEHERGWENVLSNGLLPSALVILSPYIGPMPFIASLAAVTADKFGSEIGVLESDDPISLFDLKPVKPGTSGAVSKIGTIASLAGSSIIGLFAIFVFSVTPTQALLIGLAGLAGSVIDSMFGVLEERGIGTKGTTNFICSLVGALIGYYLIA
ncbi:DUF92 domain-containing protein [Candidatus Micrarchaeota archaeon]|nr:DUF92 domain-containing protein [Candidatus Micrarchaeota archaeon]MBU1165306.1 DUF92 domain-containing protein [Candidatus Micrarchaeota archaeon]MBU1886138.1 DUF92 domain-containing protein [Candidatus Micrarchaeota archaeon]